MEDMGVDIPGFVQTMSRSQKLAWDKANEEAEKD
jgi:hypothetical protein